MILIYFGVAKLIYRTSLRQILNLDYISNERSIFLVTFMFVKKNGRIWDVSTLREVHSLFLLMVVPLGYRRSYPANPLEGRWIPQACCYSSHQMCSKKFFDSIHTLLIIKKKFVVSRGIGFRFIGPEGEYLKHSIKVYRKVRLVSYWKMCVIAVVSSTKWLLRQRSKNTTFVAVRFSATT